MPMHCISLCALLLGCVGIYASYLTRNFHRSPGATQNCSFCAQVIVLCFKTVAFSFAAVLLMFTIVIYSSEFILSKHQLYFITFIHRCASYGIICSEAYYTISTVACPPTTWLVSQAISLSLIEQRVAQIEI